MLEIYILVPSLLRGNTYVDLVIDIFALFERKKHLQRVFPRRIVGTSNPGNLAVNCDANKHADFTLKRYLGPLLKIVPLYDWIK